MKDSTFALFGLAIIVTLLIGKVLAKREEAILNKHKKELYKGCVVDYEGKSYIYNDGFHELIP